MSAEQIQQAMTHEFRDLAAVTHRPWCDPAECGTDEDAYPLHQSATLAVPADGGTIGEPATLVAYLQQSPLLPGHPPAPHDTGEVRVVIGDTGLSLDLQAAAQHAEHVLALVAQAHAATPTHA